MQVKERIEKIVGKENVLYNENMSKHTTFKTGGPAEIFVKVDDIEKLKKVLETAKEEKEDIHILGNGSNLLVKDNGVKGIVIRIDIEGIKTEEKENKIIVKLGAGEKLAAIGQRFMQNNISGFEELSGIPGTLGGAVRMNAGAHGKEIKDVIKKAKAVDYEGKEYEFTKEDMKLEYRSSIFVKEKYIIYEVELELQKGNKEEIKNKMEEYAKWRKEHQPLEYPNAGSTFKRGEDFITAKLIDECGLKGYKVGGAQISTKHAGFVINENKATTKEILELIEYTKEQVNKKFNKKIELEIEVW
ncbi:MAG: UDP-N-acetylmuramate dehydrogenase [Clostridia bacterium]|jgi:UDP-N-acetylmuramate dehydrogenase|nr:UDP-N-acetylmuramate dehydrogenase [Clostridia bacterium]